MLKVQLEAKSRARQPHLQHGGKREPAAEPRAWRLHPEMTVEGELAADAVMQLVWWPWGSGGSGRKDRHSGVGVLG